MNISRVSKAVAGFLAGVIGLGGQIVAANVVTGTALHWTQVIVGACTAVLAFVSVYAAPPNGPGEADAKLSASEN